MLYQMTLLMQRILTLLAALAFTTAAYGQSTESYCKAEAELIASEQQAHASLLDFRSSPYTDNYDLKYHRLEWTIDPAVYYIAGTVTSYFEPTQAGFQTINFDFSGALTVSEATYHGEPVSFVQQANRLEIALPEIIPAGQLDSVSVTYAGVPQSTGFGSFNQGQHAGTPVIWTLSEPYGAKDWWPAKQDLSDKIDSIDIYVRTPAEYRAAGNGLLVEEIEDGADKIYHWRHRYPIPTYLIAIAVTNYAVYSDFVPVPGASDIEVLNYVYPEQLAGIQAQTQATVEVMELFNALFGLYPFAEEKYGHAQFSWGGGMEHQTMSFMGGWSHFLQAHELAHQWFGNKITCGSWEDIWLNEGFATYLEGLTYENGLGPTNWKDWLGGKISSATSYAGGSVWVDDTTSVSRIFSGRLSYNKGAMLLHMLRWKLGDEDFFQAIRNYLADPALAFGYARTADLQAHLEEQSGQDLEEFFADWFYGEGFPYYHFTWWQEEQTVLLRIEQMPSHPSVDFFEMPVPVTFSGMGNDTTLVFDHLFSGQVFAVELPFAVSSIEFNRDLWIVSRNPTYEESEITEVTEAARGDGFRLFPNPARDQVNLRLDDPGRDDVTVRLFDAQGRLLQTRRTADEQLVLDLRNYPPGVYWVHLLRKGEVQQQKVVRL